MRTRECRLASRCPGLGAVVRSRVGHGAPSATSSFPALFCARQLLGKRTPELSDLFAFPEGYCSQTNRIFCAECSQLFCSHLPSSHHIPSPG